MAAAGVVVIPATGMEGMSFKVSTPGMPGSRGLLAGPCRGKYGEPVFRHHGWSEPTIVSRPRASGALSPSLKDRVFVKPEVLPNGCACSYISGKGIAEFGHMAVSSRRGDSCRTHVTLRTRITIPVPGSAEVTAAFNDLTPSMPAWTKRAAVSMPTQPPPMTITSRSS